MPPALLWLILGCIVAVPMLRKGSDPMPLLPASARQKAAQILAIKWGGTFGVPPSYIMTIASIESAFNPACVNRNERAMKRGGAWGMLQMTLSTAPGVAAGIKQNFGSSPEVLAALSKWKGRGEDLLDPEVGVMFGAYYLSTLYREFRTLELTAAAYQQGPATVRKLLAASKSIPGDLAPNGKIYVTEAARAYAKYA